MKCENIFCIYQKDNICTNERELSVDWRGLCKNMIPVRIIRHTLGAEKMIARLKLQDGKHYFDKEIGRITMTDEAFEFYDSEDDLD